MNRTGAQNGHYNIFNAMVIVITFYKFLTGYSTREIEIKHFSVFPASYGSTRRGRKQFKSSWKYSCFYNLIQTRNMFSK
jgi:hypothetical protein